MEVKVKAEDADGNVQFEGVLKRAQLDFILSIGIQYLLAQGAIPFIAEEGEEMNIVNGPETTQ